MSGIYRFINTTVPTKGCNLRCEYCYVRQHGEEDKLKIDNYKKWYKYPVEHMIKALSIDRLGGVCMFNMSADGETLLSPHLFDIVLGLLQNGHYVAVISNCTITEEIQKYVGLDQTMKDRLFFKASFHYRELKKKNLLDTYSYNINLLKKNGISFSVELVSNDYVLKEIDNVKEFSIREFGALPHVLGGREETIKGKYPKYETKLDNEEFYKIWGSFDSPLFNFQDSEYMTSHNNDFCYAGVYTGTFDLSSGNFSACPANRTVTNIFDDIDSPIQFLPVGNKCPFPFCFCGFFLQVLAGSCSDTYDAGYKFYEFRDRVCSDGTNWLTPSIKEVFSHTCSEYHKRVNEEQKYIINTILDVVYNGYKKNLDLRMIEIFEKYAKDNSISDVAIYGMSDLGKMLADCFGSIGIKVICGIDKNYEKISCDIRLISPDDICEDIKTIIVSAYGSYPEISKKIREKHSDIRVISILDILGDYF